MTNSCFVIISMIKNAFYLNKEDFSTLKGIISLQGNFDLAVAIHSFRRMNRDIPLGKNS